MKFLLLLIAVWILGLAEYSSGRPVVEPFHGFHELKRYERNGSFSRNRFHHKDEHGKQIFLQYEVEHTDEHLLNLDEEEKVESVRCQKNFLDIKFEHVEYATIHEKIKAGSLISGGRHWNCKNEQGLPSVILRKAVHITRNETILRIKTMDAHYRDFFRNANISFFTNKFPENHFAHMENSNSNKGTPNIIPMNQKRGFWSFFSSIWGYVRKIAESVEKAVETAFEVGRFIATGDFGMTKTFSKEISFNYDPETKKARQRFELDDSEYVICENCYGHFDVGLNFTLVIDGYSLQQFSAIADGQIQFSIHGKMNFPYSDTFSKETELGTIQMQPISFFVGSIPVYIDLSIPIAGGYEADIQVNSMVQANTYINGSAKYGIEYNPETESMEKVAQHSFEHQGEFTSFTEERMDIKAMIYIMPTLVMSVEKIGGPYISFKPFLESSIFTDNEGCYTNTNLHTIINYGLVISMGAKVDIYGIYQHEFDPVVLYSNKKPVSNGCINILESHRFGLQPARPSFIPGLVWTGKIESTYFCDDYPVSGDISFQFVGNEGDNFYFVYSSNSLYYDGTICQTQVLYQAFRETSGRIFFQAVKDEGQVLGNAYCTNPIPVRVYPEEGTFENNLQVLRMMDKCGEMTLHLS